jgi:hypothetical protein
MHAAIVRNGTAKGPLLSKSCRFAESCHLYATRIQTACKSAIAHHGSTPTPGTSAFGHLADILFANPDVGFCPKADMARVCDVTCCPCDERLFCDGLARHRLVGVGFSFNAGFHVSSHLSRLPPSQFRPQSVLREFSHPSLSAPDPTD